VEIRLKAAEMIQTWEDRDVLIKTLNNYDRALGFPVGTTTPSRYKMTDKKKQEIIWMVGNGVGGSSPGEAALTLSDTGIGPLLEGPQRQMVQTFGQLRHQAENDPQYPKTGKDAQEAFVVAKINDQFALWQRNPDNSDPRNPFKALPPGILFGARPELTQIPQFNALTQLGSSTVPPSTDDVIASIIKSSENDQSAAYGISRYFAANVITRDELLQFSAKGVKTGIPSYRIVDNYKKNPLESGVPVNLVNEAEVLNMLLRRKAMDMRQLPAELEGQF
jgi:hypothetical protein